MTRVAAAAWIAAVPGLSCAFCCDTGVRVSKRLIVTTDVTQTSRVHNPVCSPWDRNLEKTVDPWNTKLLGGVGCAGRSAIQLLQRQVVACEHWGVRPHSQADTPLPALFLNRSPPTWVKTESQSWPLMNSHFTLQRCFSALQPAFKFNFQVGTCTAVQRYEVWIQGWRKLQID